MRGEDDRGLLPLDTSPLPFLHVSPGASLGEQGKRERCLPASLLVESSCPLHIQGLTVPHTLMPLHALAPGCTSQLSPDVSSTPWQLSVA